MDGALDAISALNLWPQVMSMSPKEYDPDEQKKLVTMGLSERTSSRSGSRRSRTTWKPRGSRRKPHGTDQHQKNLLDVRPKYALSASQLLSTTRSQHDLDRDQALLMKAGTPVDIAQFGNAWTPVFPKRAMAIGMTRASARRPRAIHRGLSCSNCRSRLTSAASSAPQCFRQA